MIEIRIIDPQHQDDINIPNEPFPLIGRMIPSYTDQQWDYRVQYFQEAEISEMCFPNEHYQYAQMEDHSVFIGAYHNETCVGLAILQKAWFRYMYLYDLKVSKAYRKMGIGTALIEKAKEVCMARNYSGIYTQGQDNNLIACMFYIRTGFRIGGLDTNIYKGTAQEGKSDIIFYLDC